MSDTLRALLGDKYDDVIESAARAHAGIEPGDDWPTNAALGGSLTGTRDDEYRAGMREQATDVFLTADELHTAFGGLTPVLDADGQPVVRTVGDLGNVHLGRRIKYEGPGGYGREGIYQGTTADYLERDRCNMHVGGGYEAGVPLDTPCEVLA